MMVRVQPWNGYNFEDSILISERVVGRTAFTSIHIEELTVVARDTSSGRKKSPRHLHPVRGAAARLDESGIVYHRAEVGGGRRAGRQGDAERRTQ